jgi:hypothetical protein
MTDETSLPFWSTRITSRRWPSQPPRSIVVTNPRVHFPPGTIGWLVQVSEVICLGCGALAPDTAGPVHRYMDASPGCWQLYSELQDWKNSLIDNDGITIAQHLADAYATQHATNPDRRNRQSVTVHLMSLCASLEFEISGTKLRTIIGNWTHHDYHLLRPTPDGYPITVRNVKDATGGQRAATVEEMATSTWSAWSLHHEEIRTLLVNYLA